MRKLFLFSLTLCVLHNASDEYKFYDSWSPYDKKYGHFSESDRVETLSSIREMFFFGYDNYMKYAYPEDELDPIHCTGRGSDQDDPSNININDALGDYSLTLVDTLDTLAVMGNSSEFQRAVKLLTDTLVFKNTTVQVFEATIRVLGGLLSAHLIITDPQKPFGDMRPESYDNGLLTLAHDLAIRLLTAFDNTATGIPYPRVNLETGVPSDCVNETCTAGAGTLIMEFGVLSRLLNDPTYEAAARRAVQRLWSFRSNVTGLLGSVINIQTGEWVNKMSGVGAGMDSFFEYLLKSYILFGETEDLRMFNESYEAIKFHLRRGRAQCNKGDGSVPIYVNVHMKSGDVVNYWMDSLQAAWSAVQVLSGDIEEAICSHAVYYAIWRKYQSLPERFNWNVRMPDVSFYPLRPEFIESTYFLYQATKNPFYLHVGRDVFKDIEEHAKAKCGYCTIHDVNTKEKEDRMESFFLSETCKYLYLLFDRDNHINTHFRDYIFSTEGHIFPLHRGLRDKPWLDDTPMINFQNEEVSPVVDVRSNISAYNCEPIPIARRYTLPLTSYYMEQLDSALNLEPLT